jgi:hypothetical protein
MNLNRKEKRLATGATIGLVGGVMLGIPIAGAIAGTVVAAHCKNKRTHTPSFRK